MPPGEVFLHSLSMCRIITLDCDFFGPPPQVVENDLPHGRIRHADERVKAVVEVLLVCLVAGVAFPVRRDGPELPTQLGT
jgi:hypothetical protein